MPRCPQNPGRRYQARPCWSGTGHRHAPECRRGRSCRTERRSDSRPLPSLSRVTPSAASEHFSELLGCPISRSFTTSCVCLELRPLPSPGITRLQRYYGPLRHPSAPGLSLTGVRLIIPDHAVGLPVLRALSGPNSMEPPRTSTVWGETRAATTPSSRTSGLCSDEGWRALYGNRLCNSGMCAGPALAGTLSAAAAAETATKARMGKAEVPEPRMGKAGVSKAEAPEPRMGKAGVSKAEAPEPRMEKAGVTKAEASEPRMEEGAAEAAVKASTKPDRSSDRPSPPPRITPAPWIGIGPVWVVIRVGIRVRIGALRGGRLLIRVGGAGLRR